MGIFSISNHAEIRMSQRGFKPSDVDFILDFGDQITPDAIMLTKRAAAKLIQDFKSKIQQIERLTNKKLVVESGKIVTAYHSSKAQQRKDSRKARR